MTVVAELLPPVGPTYGRNLVRVVGSGFRLRVDPSPLGSAPQPAATPTVRVRFAGEDALRVAVVTDALLFVVAPPYRGAPDVSPIPAVAVEVANLDDAGAPIAGQTVTLANAYTYERAPLRAPRDLPDHRWRLVVREVLRLLRRNVLPGNVSRQTHFDFAAEGAAVTFKAQLPSLQVVGPRVVDSPPSYRTNEAGFTGLGGALAAEYLPPLTVDFEFELRGHSDLDRELLAMASATMDLFLATPWLVVDTSEGRQQYPLVVTRKPEVTPPLMGSAVREFTMGFLVQGVPSSLPLPQDWVTAADSVEVGVRNYEPPADPAAAPSEVDVLEDP